MLLVAHLAASAIHLEWKTNTLMRMTQTPWLFLSRFVSFSSLPDSISVTFALAVFAFSRGGGGGYKSSEQPFPLYCICTYLLHFKHVCAAHGPNFKLQLHLHNWILLCLNTLSVPPRRCRQSAPNPTEVSHVRKCVCGASVFDFRRSDVETKRGKDHNATCRHLSVTFQSHLLAIISEMNQ